MELNKKGIVFTSAIIIVSILIVSSFLFLYKTPIDPELELINNKIRNTNSFVNDANLYISNSLTIAGRSAINETITATIVTNEFINSFENKVISCMTSGSFEHFGTRTCNQDSNLTNALNSWINLSETNLNLDINLEINNILITQTSPWHIDLIANYTLLVNNSFATYNVTSTSTGKVPIQGFRDVVYELVYPSVLSVQFSNTIIRGGAPAGQWTEVPSILNNLTIEKEYFAHPLGVSFLNRMKGNYSSSSNGIISIVEPNLVNMYSGTVHIDTYFWNQTCTHPSMDLIKYNFTNYNSTNFIKMGEMGVFVGEGIDLAIIPKELANYTNMKDTAYTFNTNC